MDRPPIIFADGKKRMSSAVSGDSGCVAHKAAKTQSALKQWNWTSFGNTKFRLSELNEQIGNLEQQLQNSWHADTHTQWGNCKKQLQVETTL